MEDNTVVIDECIHGPAVINDIREYTFGVTLNNSKRIHITHYCADKKTAIIKTIQQINAEFKPHRIRIIFTKLWSGLKSSSAQFVSSDDKNDIIKITYTCIDPYDDFSMQYRIGKNADPNYFMQKFLSYTNILGEYYRYIVEYDPYPELCTYCAGGTVINPNGM